MFTRSGCILFYPDHFRCRVKHLRSRVNAVVIKAMHIYFISIIKENKLKRNSSRGDECAVVHISLVSEIFMISYL